MVTVDNFQIPEFFTPIVYEIETSKGVDPATDRRRWFGDVSSAPGVTTNRKNKQIMVMGGGPDPDIIQQMSIEHEVEIVSTLSELFATIGANEFYRLFWGTIDGAGVITATRATGLDTFSMEWGWRDPDTQVTVVTVTDSTDGTYDVIINGTSHAHVASSETVTQIRDALQVLLDASGEPISAVTTATDQITITADLADDPFTISVTSPSSGLEFTHTAGGRSWYEVLRGCKIVSITRAFKAEDTIMCRTRIIGQFKDENTREVQCSGTKLSDITLFVNEDPKVPGAHYVDTTFVFRDAISGDVIPAKVMEMEVTQSNNLGRLFADDGTYEATNVFPKERRVICNIKTAKINNEFQDRIAQRSELKEGQVDLQIIINQPGGYFEELRLDKLVVEKRQIEGTPDVDIGEENFIGIQVNAPSVIKRAA